MDADVLRILPAPAMPVPLQGLYLSEPLAPPRERPEPFVYANFIASLDGRISLPDPRSKRFAVPQAIANPRDWRLFQELAAGADALVTSGSYVRTLPRGVSARSFPISTKPEYGDLIRWRRTRGLASQPAVVIVTASLDLPPLAPLVESGRSVYVATGRAANPRKVADLESQGVRVLRVGDDTRAKGGRLVKALGQEAHRTIAMIGGGEVLNALIADDVLDRLYLTVACRILGGASFDTLLTGPQLEPPAHFKLKALHYDAEGADGSNVEQLFTILDRDTGHSSCSAP